jgi:hypothetical protein
MAGRENFFHQDLNGNGAISTSIDVLADFDSTPGLSSTNDAGMDSSSNLALFTTNMSATAMTSGAEPAVVPPQQGADQGVLTKPVA